MLFPNWTKSLENRVEFNLSCEVNCGFHCTDFRRIRSYSATSRGSLLHHNSPKSFKIVENGRNLFSPLSMTGTEPIFTKLAVARQLCVKNYYTEFCESPTRFSC